MASTSTCFTITPDSYRKPSSTIISLKPSRQFYFSRMPDNDVVGTQFLMSAKHHGNRNSRSFVSEIRAAGVGGNDPAVVRLAEIIKHYKLPADVGKRVMNAIDKCGRKVTVDDVASMAGIKYSDAQKVLVAIGSNTHGIYVEVSKDGFHFVFQKDYRSKLASKSLHIKTEPNLEKAKSGFAEYWVKVTYGTALIASILIVYTTIITLYSSK